MGATFEDVPFGELSGLELEGGVRITDVENGKWKDAGFIEGFVIAYIDKIPVENVADLNRILEFKRGGILVEGFFADGEKGTIGLDW
jgi:hypothetical protein